MPKALFFLAHCLYLRSEPGRTSPLLNNTEGAVALRTTILGTACALALGSLAAGPAMADVSNFSAAAGVGYEHASVSGFHANDWTFMGTAAVDTDWLHNMSVQGDINYQSVADHYDGDGGVHVSDLSLSISPFWRMPWGRIGAVVGLNDYDYYGALNERFVNFGGYAEWYVCPNVTLAVKGGGWTAEYYSSNQGSGYVGGQATWYAMPDLAITGTVDYTGYPHNYGSSNETNYGVMAEWLVSESTPISVYAGWNGTSVSHSSDTVSTWMVGLKVYTDQNGASTLVDRQRSGSSTWATRFNPLLPLVDF